MKQIPEKINGENTDVNGNEGPEAKKRKVVYLENGTTNGNKQDTLSVSWLNIMKIFSPLQHLYGVVTLKTAAKATNIERP